MWLEMTNEISIARQKDVTTTDFCFSNDGAVVRIRVKLGTVTLAKFHLTKVKINKFIEDPLFLRS
jgi:hypothetical protein